MLDWMIIKSEYIRGGTSYRKLSDKYGVPLSAISRTAKREKWADLRKQSVDKANIKIVESVASQEAKRAKILLSATEKLVMKIAEQIANSEIIDPQSVASYSIAIERCQRVLGIKSSKDMEEQQARIEKLRRESQSDEGQNEIKVSLGTELEELSQ